MAKKLMRFCFVLGCALLLLSTGMFIDGTYGQYAPIVAFVAAGLGFSTATIGVHSQRCH